MASEKYVIICIFIFSLSVAADYLSREEGKKITEVLPKLVGYSQDPTNQNNKGETENSSGNAHPLLVKLYAERPALRHHIAHFCPNLDDARVCIRKCSREGKPAFCGKDHRCYCGHKYSAHDEKGAMDAEDLYAQFHDLYEKYFGPNTGGGRNDDRSQRVQNLERK